MGQVSSRVSKLFNNDTEKENNSDISTNDHIKGFTTNDENSLRDGKKKSISFFSFQTFATPRLPLKRSRQSSPGVSVPQAILDIFSPCKKARMEVVEEFLDFHFLEDKATVEYLTKCKVVFIMRGLPGSGKSTVSRAIRNKYSSYEFCSADDFFMVDGEYKHDLKMIGEAHKFCQNKAVKAAVAQSKTIIIDNTNIKLWEMKFYLELAEKFNYIPIIVEPKTPWCRDLSELVKKNTHRVNKEILGIKLKSFEEIHPLYYGWFLNELDSFLLSVEGQSWIEEAFSFDVFQKDLAACCGIKSYKEFLKIIKNPGNDGIYHCTAKYTANLNASGVEDYLDSEDVQNAIGKKFDMEIIGFVLTPRTFGARVKFTPQQELLWDGYDKQHIPQEFWDVSPDEYEAEEVENDEENDMEILQMSSLSESCHAGNLNSKEDAVNENINNVSCEVTYEENRISKKSNENLSDVANCELEQNSSPSRENGIYVLSDQSAYEFHTDKAGHQLSSPVVANSVENNSDSKNDDAFLNNSLENCHDESFQASGFIQDSITDLLENDSTAAGLENEQVLSDESGLDNLNGSLLDEQEVSKDTDSPTIPNSVNGNYVDDDNTELFGSKWGAKDRSSQSKETRRKKSHEVKKAKRSKNKVIPADSAVIHAKAAFSSPSKHHSPQKNFSPSKNRSPRKPAAGVSIPENVVKPENSKIISTIRETPTNSVPNKFQPVSGKGSRAHLTLSCMPGVKPVTTGLDLLFAVELEAQALKDSEMEMLELKEGMKDMAVDDPGESVVSSVTDAMSLRKTVKHTLLLNGATLRNYGHGVWVVYLDEKLVVSSVFNMKCSI